MRLGRADVRYALMRDAQTSLQLPGTTETAPTKNIFYTPVSTTQLSPTAYPGFDIVQITQADVGVAFPVQALRALLGLAGNHELVASISIPKAENVELPALDAFDAMRTFCNPNAARRACEYDTPQMKQFLADMRRPDDPAEMVPRIAFVTNVYYARQIQYSYSTQGAAGLSASAAAIAAGTATSDKTTSNATKSDTDASDAPTVQTNVTINNSGAASSTSADATKPAATSPAAKTEESGAEQSLTLLKTQIDDLNKKLGTSGFGGTLNLVYSSSNATVLNQTFDKPIAIGFRALWFYPRGYELPVGTIGGQQ